MKKILFALCSTILFLAISCKKKEMPIEHTQMPSAPSTAKFYLHIHTNISNTEADSGMVIHDTISNRNFKLTSAQFYMSAITLHKTDGTTFTLNGVYILKTISAEIFLTGDVPAGNYSYISFDVGVDSVSNSKDPSSFPLTSPLSQASMYNGGWFGGTFIFMNVEGFADTSINQTGKFASFSYQTGTDPELRHVALPPKQFTVVANQNQVIHLIADYGKLLQVVDLKANPTSNPWDNLPVIEAMANNIPNMFRYE